MKPVRSAGLLALVLLGFIGCGSDPAAPAVGQLAGTVTVVGDSAPEAVLSGEIFLQRHPDDPRNIALRREPLNGGPHTYGFVLEAVAPGTYYLEACLSFGAGHGCVPYTTSAQGHPTAVEVRSGQVTEVQIRF